MGVSSAAARAAKRGERNPACKLTAAQVLEIRHLAASSGLLLREIGAMYGVSRSNIGAILRRRSWSWLA